MDVSVIVVNYNTAELISLCIDSILMQTDVNLEIIVVDNASQDNSLMILRRYGARITLIENPVNVGFGRANNIAARQARGQYLFLLNPDATLQCPNDLQHACAFMETHPQYALAGTTVLKKTGVSTPKLDYPGEKYFPHKFQGLPGTIAWVIGASMIIRRDAYTAVSGFDEDYFLYGEETDLCLRLRQKGWPIANITEVVIQHVGGASEKTSSTQALWTKKQQGLYLFYRKHYAPEEIKILLKKQRRQATWRRNYLGIKRCLLRLNEKEAIKYERYQTVLSLCRRFEQHF